MLQKQRSRSWTTAGRSTRRGAQKYSGKVHPEIRRRLALGEGQKLGEEEVASDDQNEEELLADLLAGRDIFKRLVGTAENMPPVDPNESEEQRKLREQAIADQCSQSTGADGDCADRCFSFEVGGRGSLYDIGRMCDPTGCPGDGFGCVSKAGSRSYLGCSCRFCFNDLSEARLFEKLTGSSVVMCDTGEAPSAYARRLTGQDDEFRSEMSPPDRPILGMCTFMAADNSTASELHIHKSLTSARVHMISNSTIVLATTEEEIERGTYLDLAKDLNVTILPAYPSLASAHLYAHKYCGPQDSVVHHIRPGTLLIRTPLIKDLYDIRDRVMVTWLHHQSGVLPSDEARNVIHERLTWDTPNFLEDQDLVTPREAHEALVSFMEDSPEVEAEVVGITDDVGGLAAVQLLLSLAFIEKDDDFSHIHFMNSDADEELVQWPPMSHGKRQHARISVFDMPVIRPRYTYSILDDKDY